MSENSPGLDESATARVVVGVLGELAVRRDHALTALPGPRARLLLAALAVHHGRARGAATLIEEIWGEQPPRAPMNALHTQVSRLRALLPDGALEAGPAGYRLRLPDDAVDLTAATRLARRADEHHTAGQTAECLAAIACARELWRGEPAADLPASVPADDLRAAAETVRRRLDRIELPARIAYGDLTTATTLARRAAETDPLDEPAHATLIRLLANTGRPNEALETFAAYRLRLIEELGADPGPALLALNTAVLRGDPIALPGAGHPATTRRPSSGDPSEPAAEFARTSSKAEAPRVNPLIRAAGWPGTLPSGATPPGPPAPEPGSVQADSSSSEPVARQSPTAEDSTALSAVGLRAEPNELLGRAPDLDAVIALSRRSRVTTVLGPGGTGKTRVATAVGQRLAREMPVVFVELAPVHADSRADIEAAIGHVLGLGELIRETAVIRAARPVDASGRLREALAERPTVLILDNCEHVIDAAAELVADLVAGCATLTVLTTSRSPLEITAESVYPLAPLAIDAAGSPATELFSARARAVRPDVRLDPETVARLCRTLDGLPLAIELAAARVRTMSVAEIEARLDQRFALLRSGDRTAPHRHRTLHAVIAWSWNLLDDDQQVALRRLSRFPGGFDLSAAEIVAAGAEVTAAVDGLAGQSLLTVLDDPDGPGIRYRMLETVREFGAEQLAAVDATTGGAETALVADRMAHWAREFALASARRYRDGEEIAAVLAVTAELDNLIVILRTAIARADAETVYTVFPVAATVWMMRGAHLELVGWVPRLLTVIPPEPASSAHADLQMLTHLLICAHLMFDSGEGVRPVMLARLHARRLLAHPGLDPGLRLLGRLITARPDGRRIGRLLADGARSNAPTARAAALTARAHFWENTGNVTGSTRDALRTLADPEAGGAWGTSMMCQHVAQLCGQSARYAEASIYYRRALELMRPLRLHDEMLETRCYLAAALLGDGRREEARVEVSAVTGADASGRHRVDDPLVRRNHRLATVATALAELELADGATGDGLGHYRRALALLGWPAYEMNPGPGAMMVAAATVDAHVLQGRAIDADELVAQILVVTGGRWSQYFDLPQIGAVACAIGSHRLATAPLRPEGLELLALAATSAARQDYPSMELARHVRLHRATVGESAMSAALGRAAGTRRMDAATRVLEIIAVLAAATDGTRP
ncbi:BTAD domain-containing putative transcriptional regulator [Nocardia sp. NPDC050378]|uniref:AfsR/SARP family transcriptional regulator n=1 Tax=Nocardia sp. NPDC050378 TaxID=3155400 RepID=UPI0033E99488